MIGTVSSHAINPALNPKLPFDPVKDFTAVSLVATIPFAMIVHPSVQAKNVQEFVALARAKPGSLNYSSAGQRDVEPSRRRAVQVDGRYRHRPHPVQGQRAGAERSRRRTGRAHVRSRADRRAAREVGRGARARRHRRAAIVGPPRTADRRRVGASRLRGERVVRHLRAGGCAGAGRPAPQRGIRKSTARFRSAPAPREPGRGAADEHAGGVRGLSALGDRQVGEGRQGRGDEGGFRKV